MSLDKRRLVNDTAEFTGMSSLEIFQWALYKFIGGDDNDSLERATEAHNRFMWNGTIPTYVENWCLDALVPKPRNPHGKKARKLSDIKH